MQARDDVTDGVTGRRRPVMTSLMTTSLTMASLMAASLMAPPLTGHQLGGDFALRGLRALLLPCRALTATHFPWRLRSSGTSRAAPRRCSTASWRARYIRARFSHTFSLGICFLAALCPPNPPLVKLRRFLGQSQRQAQRAPIRCELRAILSNTFTPPTVDFHRRAGRTSG